MAYGKIKADTISWDNAGVDVDIVVQSISSKLAINDIGVTVQGYDANTVKTAATQTLTNKTLTDPAIIGTIKEGLFSFTGTTEVEIDPSNGSIQLLLLDQANCTPKGTNFINGEKVLLMIDDGFGETPGELTWTDTTFGYTGVQWIGGYAPKLTRSGYTVVQLWKAYGTVYGALLGIVQSLDSPELIGAPYVNGSYRSNVTAVAALDIDCSLGNYYTKTIIESSTFTFSNVPQSRSYAFTLCITHDSGTITWPASVKWPQDTAPSLTTYRNHKFMFSTYDGGTVWYGAALPNYSY
jgi:hypothetical protein